MEFYFAKAKENVTHQKSEEKPTKKEKLAFFDGLQGAFAFAKTPFHSSYTSWVVLLFFMQLPDQNEFWDKKIYFPHV